MILFKGVTMKKYFIVFGLIVALAFLTSSFALSQISTGRAELDSAGVAGVATSLVPGVLQMIDSMEIAGILRLSDSMYVGGSVEIAEELKVKELFVTSHAHIEIFSTDSAATTVTSGGTFVNMANTFTSNHASFYTLTTDTITYTGTDSIHVAIDFSISAQSGTVKELGIWQLFKNGVSIGLSEGGKERNFDSADTQGSLSYGILHQMVNGDIFHWRFTDIKGSTWGFLSIHIRFSEVYRWKRVAGG